MDFYFHTVHMVSVSRIVKNNDNQQTPTTCSEKVRHPLLSEEETLSVDIKPLQNAFLLLVTRAHSSINELECQYRLTPSEQQYWTDFAHKKALNRAFFEAKEMIDLQPLSQLMSPS